MITLLASMVGFIGSVIPEVIKILKSHKENQHELAILDKKIEMLSIAKNTNEMSILETNKNQINFDNCDNKIVFSGIRFIDGLNASVRPVVAYSFFFVYVTAKILKYKMMSTYGLNIIDFIWESEDQAAFATIISFYFGQRTFSKNKKM